ncbi:polysaccharide pyruvyl transferase family protein [Micromonospora endolithica]|uniref:Polysaccharide pyruvyl transferase family protein n=1 Tax=Micromonospora endolithica TaxID=230091 RepID=A0A3A9ZC10_9ACTN|nr:polysaccharide pyruvyl transferase family protein [Micromonospora endolithica]RKN45434.1 polysaccharide pyruvyl transferase family protein [Micromonospora endolithica]TWJ22843.1 polysaccharide pyruvyl transferase [Micromonospora endolithica]
MHQRILLRARKGPFDVLSPEDTFARNWIGDNNGNLVFSHAAHKLLATSTAEITPSLFRADPREADEINEKYDVFVIPLANAFRRSFVNRLVPMTRLIERLKIPVVVFGVGVQTNVDGDREYLRPIDEPVAAFCRAVLDRSHTIGVRGEVTESYLRTLGFSAVEQIGCPSMFLHGDSLRVEKAKPALSTEDRVALNISPYVSSMAGIIRHHHARYPNLRYLPQDLKTLGTLLYGDAPELRGRSNDIPVHTSHPLFVEDKVRMFVDPWPWMEYLSGFDFAFGTRIHGTITALISGTPGYLFAHDSRTLELARYFDIPHRIMRDVPADIDAAQLYAEADYTALNEGHKARFAAVTTFLAKHDLGHSFADGQSATLFDQRVRETTYPPVVRPATSTAPAELLARIQRLRDENASLRETIESLRGQQLRERVKQAVRGPARRLLRR